MIYVNVFLEGWKEVFKFGGDIIIAGDEAGLIK